MYARHPSIFVLVICFACVEVGPSGPVGPAGQPGAPGPTGSRGRPGAVGPDAGGIIWLDADDAEVGSFETFALLLDNREDGYRWIDELVYTDDQGVKWPINLNTGELQQSSAELIEDRVYFLESDCSGKKLYNAVSPGLAFRINLTWYVVPEGVVPFVDVPAGRLLSSRCLSNHQTRQLVFVDELEIVDPPSVSFRVPLRPVLKE